MRLITEFALCAGRNQRDHVIYLHCMDLSDDSHILDEDNKEYMKVDSSGYIFDGNDYQIGSFRFSPMPDLHGNYTWEADTIYGKWNFGSADLLYSERRLFDELVEGGYV